MTVWAQQTVFIGAQGYDDLATAVAAAADGDVITVKADQTLSGARITVTPGDSRAITIKGEGDSKVKLTRDSKNKNLLFLLNGGDITFENLVFDNNHVDKAMIEANDGSVLHMQGCDLLNSVNKGVQIKTTATLADITASGSTSDDKTATILVGAGDKLTISGNADYDMYLENTYKFYQGESLTGRVAIKLPQDKYNDGRVVCQSVPAEGVYTLAGAPGDNYAFEIINSQLTVVRYVIKNENSGVNYRTVMDAYTAVKGISDEAVTFSVLDNADVTDRIGDVADGKNFDITFRGIKPEVTLTKKFNNKIFVSNNQNLTFENLTLDCNGSTRDGDFEVSMRTLTMRGVKITNSAAAAGLFKVKEGARTLVFDGVTAENCTAPVIDLNGRLRLSGNTGFSINVANAAATITAAGELTNAGPIAIIPTALTLATGTVLVKDCDDAARFTLADTEDWTLAAEGGNLVAAPAPLTIGDPAVESEGCYLHQPGSDIIIVPAGKVGIIRFDLAEGTSLRYRFTPYVAAVAEGDAPAWSDYDHAAGIALPAAGTLDLQLTKGERTGARTMYVYDNPELTGITDAAVDAAAPARYYDLRGIEVTGADMRPGIYIERRGSSARRIVVR